MGRHNQTEAELAMYKVVTREVNHSNGYHRSDNIFACYSFSPKELLVSRLFLKHINYDIETS
jgi:hypothetical protein